MAKIVAPFPYFGNKSIVARRIWERFGSVNCYIEPFCGSAAVLFGAPEKASRETINDMDGGLVNVWRTCRYKPEAIDDVATWPRSEIEKRARRKQFDEGEPELVEKLKADVSYFDAELAAAWVFVRASGIIGNWECGSVSRPTTERQGPFRATYAGSEELQTRLQGVRILCGDWARCVSENELFKGSTRTAVFLDPPYASEANRQMGIYTQESGTVAHDVRRWALEAGEDRRLRIALCGYEGEHDMPDSWECFAWKSTGSFVGKNEGKRNYERERIWFSPGCERPERQLDLFGGGA